MHEASENPGSGIADSAIDLGPRLPMAAYHAFERWHPERIRALALYCSDGRWGAALDEFCHRHLQIPRYDRCAVPGGPAWIADLQSDASANPAVRIQLDFLVQVHSLERIVLIAHFGCAWYGQKRSQSPEDCLAAQAADIRSAAANLRLWYPCMQQECYLAMRQHEQISYHELPTGEI